MEYARNVLGIENAEHEEVTPDALNPIISKLNCSIAGTTQRVKILLNTLVYKIYQTDEVTESFNCNYGLNSEYHDRIAQGGIKISGIDSNGEVRIIELGDHRFFIATLFLPQIASNYGKSHPLIKAYLNVAMDFQGRVLEQRE